MRRLRGRCTRSWVGISAGVLVALFLPTSCAVGGGGSVDGYCALMTDSEGLYIGNPVTQMGYSVGAVTAIEPEGDHVRVSFSLESGRKYPSDVSAVTRSKSLLADRGLELVGNYLEGRELSPGVCIELSKTATPQSISQITGSVADFIESIAPDDGQASVAAAISGLNAALKGNGQHVNNLLSHSSEAVADPDKMIADINSIIVSMAPLTSDATAQLLTIRKIFDTLPTVLESAADGLWPGGTNLIRGIGPLIAVLYDVQVNYGDSIWAGANSLADVIHIAATRSTDISDLVSAVPSIAGLLQTHTADADASALRYSPPVVSVSTPDGKTLCGLLNAQLANSCTSTDEKVQVADVRLFDLILAEGSQ